MNRQILFRGKRKDNGEWIEGYFLQLHRSERAFVVPKQFVQRGILRMSGETPPKIIPIEVLPETVGQFTGLCDKNGKKIFEGDIVKGDLGLGYGDNENHIAYIEYQEDGMSFCLVEILEEDFGKCAEISDDLEVIGNIYDNPELLYNGD